VEDVAQTLHISVIGQPGMRQAVLAIELPAMALLPIQVLIQGVLQLLAHPPIVIRILNVKVILVYRLQAVQQIQAVVLPLAEAAVLQTLQLLLPRLLLPDVREELAVVFAPQTRIAVPALVVRRLLAEDQDTALAQQLLQSTLVV